jgi:SSS family solute:Na+ symporter
MKVFTARDDRTLRRTVVLYPTFQIFLVPLFLIGFSGVMFASAPERTDQILPHMLMNMEIPAVLVGLFCAGALAASMSSGDAMAHAAASIAVRDGLVEGLGLQLDPGKERDWIRFAVVGVMLLSFAVAVWAIVTELSLVFMLLTAYGAVVQFMPVVLATLYWRRATAAGVLAGLLAGFAITVLCVVHPEWRPFPFHAGIYGFVVNVALLIGVSLATSRPPAPSDVEFFDVAGES